MKQFGYIRVSSKDQNIDRQLLALESYQIPEDQIYCDHQSGKDFERPAYQELLLHLQKGDLLIIKSIDRLGRNYDEILEQWALITKKIGADILVLDMTLLDTRERNGDLTGAFIADLVLQILAYVAQTEREFIHRRQAEGIAAAKARGVRFGRKPCELPERFDEICRMHLSGKISVRSAAKELGMSKSSFHRKFQQRIQASDSFGEMEEMDNNYVIHQAKPDENEKILSEKNIPRGRLFRTKLI